MKKIVRNVISLVLAFSLIMCGFTGRELVQAENKILGSYKAARVFDDSFLLDLKNTELAVVTVECSTTKDMKNAKEKDYFSFSSSLDESIGFRSNCKGATSNIRLFVDGLKPSTTYYVRISGATSLNGSCQQATSPIFKVKTKNKNASLKSGIYATKVYYKSKGQKTKNWAGKTCASSKAAYICGSTLFVNGSVAQFNKKTAKSSKYLKYEGHSLKVSPNIKIWSYTGTGDRWDFSVYSFNDLMRSKAVQPFLILHSNGKEITGIEVWDVE